MATRAIKPRRDETMLSDWESLPERAPSVVRDDKPLLARFLALIGLLYVSGYIAMQEIASDRGFYAGLGLGALGLVGLIGAIVRSLGAENQFLVPDGLILIGCSLVYLTVAVGVCTDWPLIVVTRRE